MRARLALLIVMLPAVVRAQLPRAVWFDWREPHIAILPDSSGTFLWVQTGAAGDTTRPQVVDVTFDPARVAAWIAGARAFLRESPPAIDTTTTRSSEILHGSAGDGLYLVRQRTAEGWSSEGILAIESLKAPTPVIIHGEPGYILAILDSLQAVAAVTPYSEAASQRMRAEIERKFDTPARPDRGNLPPAYPFPLLRSGQDGLVIINFAVSALGKVDMASVRPFLVTHPAFFDAVMTALPFMKFYPAVVGGGEVESRVTMPFQFAIVKKPRR
jgi:TonB family protein